MIGPTRRHVNGAPAKCAQALLWPWRWRALKEQLRRPVDELSGFLKVAVREGFEPSVEL
jgi:hypothetical protein